MRSVNYLGCRKTCVTHQEVIGVKPVINAILQGRSFPVRSHVYVNIDERFSNSHHQLLGKHN